jgi:uncharacterized protein (DUF2342 family)
LGINFKYVPAEIISPRELGEELTLLRDDTFQAIVDGSDQVSNFQLGLGKHVSNAAIPVVASSIVGICRQNYQGQPPKLLISDRGLGKISSEIMEQNSDLSFDDVALWVIVHEMTHVAQMTFTNEFISQMEGFFKNMDESRKTRGSGSMAKELKPMMTYVEGMAEHVMDQAIDVDSDKVIALREAINARREKKSLRSLVFGQKIRQYQDGVGFADKVAEKVGPSALTWPFISKEMMPTEEEIIDPDAWIERVFLSGKIGLK